jgi:hypothetical protein
MSVADKIKNATKAKAEATPAAKAPRAKKTEGETSERAPRRPAHEVLVTLEDRLVNFDKDMAEKRARLVERIEGLKHGKKPVVTHADAVKELAALASTGDESLSVAEKIKRRMARDRALLKLTEAITPEEIEAAKAELTAVGGEVPEDFADDTEDAE